MPATTQLERIDGTLIVRISGEIDQDQCAEIGGTIREELRTDDRALLLNLAEVTFCGSAALALFVQLQDHAVRSSTQFALINPSAIIKAMIAVCGLGDSLRTWSDTEAA